VLLALNEESTRSAEPSTMGVPTGRKWVGLFRRLLVLRKDAASFWIGGILGTAIGLVPTIVLGGIVSTLAALWIFLGPVIQLREQPAPVTA